MSLRSFDPYSLIKDFGVDVTLHKQTSSGSYDPSTGTVSGGVTTNYSVRAVFYDINAGINNGEVRRGVRKCVISALGLSVSPDDGDSISGLGDKVHIIRVTTHYSNGTPVMYTCEVAE